MMCISYMIYTSVPTGSDCCARKLRYKSWINNDTSRHQFMIRLNRRLRISERVNTSLDRSYHRGTCTKKNRTTALDTDSDAKSNLNPKENTPSME